MCNRTDLSGFKCHKCGRLAVQRDEFDLESRAGTIYVHDRSDVTVRELLIRQIACQYNAVVFFDRVHGFSSQGVCSNQARSSAVRLDDPNRTHPRRAFIWSLNIAVHSVAHTIWRLHDAGYRVGNSNSAQGFGKHLPLFNAKPQPKEKLRFASAVRVRQRKQVIRDFGLIDLSTLAIRKSDRWDHAGYRKFSSV